MQPSSLLVNTAVLPHSNMQNKARNESRVSAAPVFFCIIFHFLLLWIPSYFTEPIEWRPRVIKSKNERPVNKQRAADCRTSAIEFSLFLLFPVLLFLIFSSLFTRNSSPTSGRSLRSRRSSITAMELPQLHRGAHCSQIHNLSFTYFFIDCPPFYE